jgi:hypothetical protein
MFCKANKLIQCGQTWKLGLLIGFGLRKKLQKTDKINGVKIFNETMAQNI